jgi:hypothetical protein
VILAGGHWSSIGHHIEAMQPPIKDWRQWGGCGEAVVISRAWNVIIAFFAEGGIKNREHVTKGTASNYKPQAHSGRHGKKTR